MPFYFHFLLQIPFYCYQRFFRGGVKRKQKNRLADKIDIGSVHNFFVSIKFTEYLRQESRKNEAVLKTERDQWKEQYQAIKHEVERLRGW